MSDAGSRTRRPRQARGQERVEALLDAAAALLAEGGVEAVTTNAVAARADAHIGSLYHFFPNKQAILDALAERYVAEITILWDEVFDEERMRTMPAAYLIEGVIEQMAAFELAHQGFQALFYGAGESGATASARIGEELMRRVSRGLAARYADHHPERLWLVAAVMVGAVKAILPGALPGTHAGADALRAELKRMLIAYLDTLG